MISNHELSDYITRTLAISSTLHTFLPPWDWHPAFVEEGLADFPKLQKFFRRTIAILFHNRYYKLSIYILGGMAMALRSTIWKKSISMPVQFQKIQNGDTSGKV